MRRRILLAGLVTLWVGAAKRGAAQAAVAAQTYPIAHSDLEWRALLNTDQYRVLRQAGTEQPFASPLVHEHRAGVFTCAGCGQPDFSSATKFDSNTGWPSFWQAVPGAIGTQEDHKLSVLRIEVHCSRCGGHLGHVFEDGPPPTGLRYCMNGLALLFVPI